MLVSVIQVSIDHHYCGGVLADTRISFTGKLASCGMEQVSHTCPDQVSITGKCCDDQVTVYNITSQYSPEYFRLSHPAAGKDLPAVHCIDIVLRSAERAVQTAWVRPPGANPELALSLAEICVFRI